MADPKHFRHEKIEDVIVVHLLDSDFFDRLIINELQDEMIVFVNELKPRQLVISFARVRAISSEVINSLLRAREWSTANDGRMMLCDMRKEIRQAFKMLNLDGRVFEIHDSLHKAIESFQG